MSIEIPFPTSLYEAEKFVVLETLRFAGGNMTHAARLLVIDRRTLYRKVRLFGIDRETLLVGSNGQEAHLAVLASPNGSSVSGDGKEDGGHRNGEDLGERQQLQGGRGGEVDEGPDPGGSREGYASNR